MTKRILTLGILAVASMATSGQSMAEVTFARFLQFGVTGTDNPTLAATADDADVVFSVKPSVELKFTGNRIGAVLIGEVEHFRYNDAKKDITDPRLLARARGTLVDNLLYLDTTLTYSKLAPESNFLRPSNDTDPALKLKGRVFVYREFASNAEVYVGLTHESFFADATKPVTTEDSGIGFSIGRNQKDGGVFGSIGGYVNDSRTNDKFLDESSLYATIGTQVSDSIIVEVTGGTEQQKLINDSNVQNPVTLRDAENSIWNAGITWSPSELTKLTLGYGERYLTEGPSLKFSHRKLNSLIKADYSRDVSSRINSLGSIAVLTDSTGGSQVDPGTVTIDDSSLSTALDDLFLDNRLKLSYKLTGRRSDFIFDSIISKQDQIGGEQTIKSWLGRLVFDRKLSNRSTLRLQYDYQKSDAPLSATRNFTENRFAVKYILKFDNTDSTRDDEFGNELESE